LTDFKLGENHPMFKVIKSDRPEIKLWQIYHMYGKKNIWKCCPINCSFMGNRGRWI